MARKTLLNESEIRRFLKLADVGLIGDNRIKEIGDKSRKEGLIGGAVDAVFDRDDDEMGGLDVDVEEEPPEEMPGEEGELDDLEGDLEGGEEGGGRMVSVDDFMSALESALEDVVGEPTSIEVSDDEEELEDPLGDLGEPGEEEVGLPEPGEEEMDEPLEEDAIVNEVARRVAARLVKERNKSNIADQLADRILHRLTK